MRLDFIIMIRMRGVAGLRFDLIIPIHCITAIFLESGIAKWFKANKIHLQT